MIEEKEQSEKLSETFAQLKEANPDWNVRLDRVREVQVSDPDVREIRSFGIVTEEPSIVESSSVIRADDDDDDDERRDPLEELKTKLRCVMVKSVMASLSS